MNRLSFRKRLGLSRAQMARALGLPVELIEQSEATGRPAAPVVARRLALVYGDVAPRGSKKGRV